MENRENTRFPFDIESELKYNNKIIQGDVLNISLTGMYINVLENIPESSIVDVTMLLSGENKEMEMTFSGKVVRKESSGVAVKLINLNLESIIELRDLLIDKDADTDMIMTEFEKIVTRMNIN